MLEALASIDIDALMKAFLLIVTTVSTIIAALNGNKATTATAEKEEAQAEAAAKEQELSDTQAFFDPDCSSVMTPTPNTPKSSYTMSEATKHYLLSGESEADQLSMTKQIEEAEKSGYVDYKIVYSRGSYEITYGLIKSATKNN
jgi:hypothetical protein